MCITHTYQKKKKKYSRIEKKKKTVIINSKNRTLAVYDEKRESVSKEIIERLTSRLLLLLLWR